MNNLKFLGLCLSCFIVCVRVSAQNKPTFNDFDNTNKPKLFAQLPEKITLDVKELESLFIQPKEASEIAIQSADKKTFNFSGKVISATSKYDSKIRTLIIRSINFSGATLTLSSSTQPDGTVEYSGRIISFQHGDLYQLEKQKTEYYFIKKNFRDLVNE
jgi:hypothetical protein